jgi:hypothetical protein
MSIRFPPLATFGPEDEQTAIDEPPASHGSFWPMSGTARRSRRPMPPPVGWTPTEAFDILCPSAATLVKERGEALENAINQDLHRLSFRVICRPEHHLDAWRTLQLLEAVRRRPDLQLTGQNPYAPLASRTAVAPDVLEAACERNNNDQAVLRRWVHIDFRNGRISSGHDVPPTHFDARQAQQLADVRIEACKVSSAQPALLAGETDERPKPEFDKGRGEQWLIWIREDFSAKGQPMPPTNACLAAAKVHFSGPIPRDPFYALHKKVAGADHRQGPSGPRQTARATAESLQRIKPPQ